MSASKNSQSGFSLIELLVAVVILAVGLLGLAQLQVTAIKVNSQSMTSTTARALAQKVVETVDLGSVEFPGIEDPRDDETARYSIALAQEVYGWVPQISLEDSLRSIANVEFGD